MPSIEDIKRQLLKAAESRSASARSEARGGAAPVSVLRAQFEATIASQAKEKAELEKLEPPPSQALRTSKLRFANCHNSKNPLVKQIWSDVQKYILLGHQKSSMMSAGDIANRVRILDSIMVGCATYMSGKFYRETKRSGSGTARRKQRYDAFDELLADAAAELSRFGARTLHRPNQFRNTFDSKPKRNVNYWLERLDPSHRPGFIIAKYYREWTTEQFRREKGHIPTETFFEYLDRIAQNFAADHSLNIFRVSGYGYDGPPLTCRVHFSRDDKLLKDYEDHDYDTGIMMSESAGHGFGIFVCSMPIRAQEDGPVEHMLFSWQHSLGFFYHASFLGGAPVLAAGEWMVVDGQIKVIMGKSGHYRTTPQNMLTFLRTCRDIPGEAICRPDFSNNEFYSVQEFRVRGLNALKVPDDEVNKIIDGVRAQQNGSLFSQPNRFVRRQPFGSSLSEDYLSGPGNSSDSSDSDYLSAPGDSS